MFAAIFGLNPPGNAGGIGPVVAARTDGQHQRLARFDLHRFTDRERGRLAIVDGTFRERACVGSGGFLERAQQAVERFLPLLSLGIEGV